MKTPVLIYSRQGKSVIHLVEAKSFLPGLVICKETSWQDNGLCKSLYNSYVIIHIHSMKSILHPIKKRDIELVKRKLSILDWNQPTGKILEDIYYRELALQVNGYT